MEMPFLDTLVALLPSCLGWGFYNWAHRLPGQAVPPVTKGWVTLLFSGGRPSSCHQRGLGAYTPWLVWAGDLIWRLVWVPGVSDHLPHTSDPSAANHFHQGDCL